MTNSPFQDSQNQDRNEWIKKFALVAALSMELAVPVGLGVFAGAYVDRQFQLKLIGVIIGGIAGILVSGWALVRFIKKIRSDI
jgi:F0F1-type ATP synthase assembly protein I